VSGLSRPKTFITPVFKINKEVKTKPEIKEKIIFMDEDIKSMFLKLNDKNSNFITIIYLLFYTALRPLNILTISADNIDLKSRTLNYHSPNRKKFREIAFHKDLAPILESRISLVNEAKLLEYSSVENLGKAITRYVRTLKLRKEYTARTFRKTFITLCRSNYNMDASTVRELVGHEHSNTADRFHPDHFRSI